MTPPRGWQFVGPYMVPVPRRILISEIQARVARHYGLPARVMHDGSQFRSHARPRQVAMYLTRCLTTRSLPEIGRYFGGRDHTTVIHAIRTIAAKREDDAELETAIRRITSQLEGVL